MRGGEPANEVLTGSDVAIYPTCVGVNRSIICASSYCFRHLPHMRGGEPDDAWYFSQVGDIYPTCVGVNRNTKLYISLLYLIYPTCGGVNRELAF